MSSATHHPRGIGSPQTPPRPDPFADAPRSQLRVLMVSRGVVAIGRSCGGAELVAYEIARSLARGGHIVTVVSEVAEERQTGAPGVEFVSPRRWRRLRRLVRREQWGIVGWMLQHLLGNLAAAAEARRLLRVSEFDVIHLHGALSALLVARRSRLPAVYTEHDAPPWCCRYRFWSERLLRTLIYRVVNVSAWQAVSAVAGTFDGLPEEIVRRGVAAECTQWIPNATDPDRFRPRAGHQPPTRFERYCLFVGRLTPRKAPDLLLRALADTRDVCCVFAGDGPMRGRLERLAHELGLAERVQFLGSVDSAILSELYAGAELLVLPSVSEASPLVVVEAMACGIPVLGTRIAGFPSLIGDFDTGFLVKPGDVGALAVAMQFLSRDRLLRESMGLRAHARAREQFTWTAVTDTYLRLYRLVMEPPVAPVGLVAAEGTVDESGAAVALA